MKIIIAGAGEVGTHLARLLGEENHDITVMAVSYTHLDVYKRQRLGTAAMTIGAARPALEIATSYTCLLYTSRCV